MCAVFRPPPASSLNWASCTISDPSADQFTPPWYGPQKLIGANAAAPPICLVTQPSLPAMPAKPLQL